MRPQAHTAVRGGSRWLVGTTACIAALAILALLGAPQPASSAPINPLCVPGATPPPVGLSLVSATPVDARVSDLSLRSAAMGGIEHVDVMLPSHFDPSGTTRYRTLYLLHGALGSHTDYVSLGIEAMLGNLPLIVVMPDGGPLGYYTDWYGQAAIVGPGGPAPAWETFHISELIPWIDGHYPTVATRGGRAIAGISMGGYGAMKYAARHPELFSAAASFSGALDIDLSYPAFPLVDEVLGVPSLLPGNGPPGLCTWGDPLTEDVVWRDNDPTYLASNLNGVALFLASGNGTLGPYDSLLDPVDLVAMVVEAGAWSMNQAFAQALDVAGIPHTDDFYGSGTHTLPYWKADLEAFLPWVTDHLGGDGVPPSFSYRSADPSFGAWGWSFHAERTVQEFTYLTGVGSGGLTAQGCGTLDVTTDSLYQPGAVYKITAGASPFLVQAGTDGRLRFSVDLGPSHVAQQFDFSPAATSNWKRVTVLIEA
jgi:S-formylglutathione hydrolase FrmB